MRGIVACSLDQWSTSGVSLATGLTGCLVLLLRTWANVRRHDRVEDTRPEPPAAVQTLEEESPNG